MSAVTQHTMRTPTLQPVPESLPVTTDHVPSVPKSAVKSKVGSLSSRWTLLIIILSTTSPENQFDQSCVTVR